MSYDFQGKNVFLSGPVTGLSATKALVAFGEASRDVSGGGARSVYNPARLIPCRDEPHRPHEQYMLATLGALTTAAWDDVRGNVPLYDTLALLPGWEGSEGAKVERMVAEACGIEVVELGDAL